MADQAPSADMGVLPQPPNTNGTAIQDVEMKEDPLADASTASPLRNSELAPATPVQAQPTSRAHSPPKSNRASPHPSTAIPAPPTQPSAHGSPARVYLNQKVTPHLLEGVKYLAVHEPEKPLQWLADFLKKRGEEVEG